MITCPRRFEAGQELLLGADDFIVADGMLICTYCGSVEPGLLLDCARKGIRLTPKADSFRMDVPDLNGPFYFAHFSEEQSQEFLDLYNAGALNLDCPGYFHVIPYFAYATDRVSTKIAQAVHRRSDNRER